MKRLWATALCTLFLAAGPVLAQSTTVAAGPSALGALPADTSFVLHVPSVSGFRAKLESSPLAKIAAIPEVRL